MSVTLPFSYNNLIWGDKGVIYGPGVADRYRTGVIYLMTNNGHHDNNIIYQGLKHGINDERLKKKRS